MSGSKRSIGIIAAKTILQDKSIGEDEIFMLMEYYTGLINKNLETDSEEERALTANKHRLLASKVLRHYVKDKRGDAVNDQILAREFLSLHPPGGGVEGKRGPVWDKIKVVRPTVELMQSTRHSVLGPSLFPRRVAVDPLLGRFEIALDDTALFGRVQDSIANGVPVVAELFTITGARHYARIANLASEFSVSPFLMDLLQGDKVMQVRLLTGLLQVEHMDFTYFGPKLSDKEAVYDKIRDYLVGVPVVHIGMVMNFGNMRVAVRSMVPEGQGFLATPFDADIEFSMQEELIEHRIAAMISCKSCFAPSIGFQCSACNFVYCSNECATQHWNRNRHGFVCVEKRGVDEMEVSEDAPAAAGGGGGGKRRNNSSDDDEQVKSAALTAMALVNNPKRLQAYVKQMPRDYLVNLLQGTVKTSMTKLLATNNYFWFLVLHHLLSDFEPYTDYKSLVRRTMGL